MSTGQFPAPFPKAGTPAVDRYLDQGYDSVVGMSSKFAAAISAALLKLQSEMGISGPIAEIGTFEGRFFIALTHALKPGENALGKADEIGVGVAGFGEIDAAGARVIAKGLLGALGAHEARDEIGELGADDRAQRR